jgi:hypothetical protein
MTALKYTEAKFNNIAIFTNLDNDEDGSIRTNMSLLSDGFTCCWVIAKSREIEKIILYIRENGINKIYKADYNYRENVNGRRYRIHYKNLKFIENTPSNWIEFAHTQSPIRYIDKQKI